MKQRRGRMDFEIDRPLWPGHVSPFHILFGFAHAIGALVAAALLAAGVAGTWHHATRWRDG